MKIKLTILIFGCILLSSNHLKSQDFLDSITVAACDCINNLDTPMAASAFEMQAGLCMFEGIGPYEKEFQAYLGVDEFNFSDGKTMSKIGETIGMKMITHCPEMLLKLANPDGKEAVAAEAEAIDDYNFNKLVIKVTKIEINQFITFTGVDKSEKRYKLLWLDDFSNSEVLIDNYENLKGKTCSFRYQEIDLFDPRIQEYHTFKVITGFSLVTE